MPTLTEDELLDLGIRKSRKTASAAKHTALSKRDEREKTAYAGTSSNPTLKQLKAARKLFPTSSELSQPFAERFHI
jgi:hypothetical protein